MALTQPTSLIALLNLTEQQPLLIMTITEEDSGKFLEIIRGRKNGALDFKELTSFMRKVGYIMMKCGGGGSGRRFILKAFNGSYLDTIVFHEFHGRGESKVPRRLARA
jgi:hypothetical protein